MARSNLVQVKKNKTVEWLHDLPSEQQLKVIDLAIEKREEVRKEFKSEQEHRIRDRRQKLLQRHIRREALRQKAQQERDELSQMHLITTSEELQQALKCIDAESLSAAKKRL